jgi:predicted RNA-binding protein (virulence factor B family)
MEMLVLAKTPLGYKVIVENRYEGMLFANEIFEELRVGDRKRGYIKATRKDGKLDMSLQPIGKKAKVDEAQAVILEKLKSSEGSLPLTYKSDAEEIKKMLGMSKKNFKRTLTAMIESGKVELLEDAIRLK